jgi:hypothetical protein
MAAAGRVRSAARALSRCMPEPIVRRGDTFPEIAVLDCAGNRTRLQPRRVVLLFYRGHW